MGLFDKVAKKVASHMRGDAPDARTDGSSAVSSPAGGTPGQNGEAVAEAADFQSMECGAQELKERLDAGEEVVIVDVRQPPELTTGVLPGTRFIPMTQLATRWEELKDADEIVIYCAVGARSLQAAKFLRSKGLINATSLEGGIGAWRSAGGRLVDPA